MIQTPETVCFTCGSRYGNSEHSNRIATVRLGYCDICQSFTIVSHIREFGGLNHQSDIIQNLSGEEEN